MHIYILTMVCINYFSFTLVVHKFPLNKICREGLLLNVIRENDEGQERHQCTTKSVSDDCDGLKR